MPEPLLNHITQFVALKDGEQGAILAHFKPVHVKKKENLVEAGQLCRSHYFVVKGCLRMFFINEKGVEQTIQFAIENWWLTDYMAFQKQQRTDFFIQAVENTDVVAIDFHAQEQLIDQFPQLDRYYRLVYQKAYAAAQLRIKYLYDFTREELYHHFNDKYPDFIQRIPQYLLASFLGFTPEYLSEIRRKNRS
ncbi:Crp/Fnr family transcriptional regulator [Larkinella harenae]